MNLSSVVLQIVCIKIERERGGGGAVNLISEQVLSKLPPDINWSTLIENPLKRYIGVSLKFYVQFVPGFAVIKIPTPMNWRNSPNSSAGTLIIILASTRMTSLTKYFGRKSKTSLR